MLRAVSGLSLAGVVLATSACRAEERSEPAVVETQPDPQADFDALARELVEMAGEDQRSLEVIRDDPFDDRIIEITGDIRRHNTTRLGAIVDEIGWPSVSKVGLEAAEAAWLVAQHADHEPEFQRHCLALLSAAHDAGDVPGWQFAYLSDRVSVNAHQATLYGTQGGHGYTPQEEAEIDARRRALGMETLAEFRARKAQPDP